jgi:hypothetical protein
MMELRGFDVIVHRGETRTLSARNVPPVPAKTLHAILVRRYHVDDLSSKADDSLRVSESKRSSPCSGAINNIVLGSFTARPL